MNQNVSIHQQIVQRIKPGIILLFVVAGFTAVVILQAENAEKLRQERQSLTIYMQQLINQEISNFVDEADGVVLGRAVNQYTLVVRTNPPGGVTQALTVAQSELLQSFDDLMDQHRDEIQSIRYITNDSNVWGETVNINGDVFLETDYRPYTPVDEESYRAAFQPENDASVFFSAVSTTQSQDQFMSLYIPVRNTEQTQVLALVEIQLRLQPLLHQISILLEESIYNNNAERSISVFDSQQRLLFTNQPGENAAEASPVVMPETGEVSEQISGVRLISAAKVGDYAGSGFPWLIVLEDHLLLSSPERYVLSAIQILSAIGLCVLTIWLVERVLKRVLVPVEEARVLVSRLTQDIQTRAQTQTLELNGVKQHGETTSELDDIAESVERAASYMNQLREGLEREDQRRRRDIEIVGRIGRETAALLDINQVFDRAIEMICRDMGYYHAQVFLLDDVGGNAVLVRSRGEAGQQLLAKNHKLAVGSDSVIGRVTGRNEPVIVNDTRAPDSGHSFNPLLPETRAELGIPMVVNNRVIGALDIQSTSPYTFSTDDLPTFRLLADQLAIAVNTARLVEATRQQVAQMEALNRQYTRKSWEETEELGIREKAYRYDLVNIEPASPSEPAADRGNGGLALPISLRGEVIGMLSAAANEGQFFTEGDEVILRAVADRVALAIENARLFQETQVTLAETSVLYRLSRYLNEASTMQDILNALIVSVMPDADGAQVWKFDEYDTNPEWMQIVTDLSIVERDDPSATLNGLRLRISDHPFLKRLKSNQIALINDTRTDNRLDSGLQIIFRRLQARSVVIIPLNVRGEWPGLIMVEYEEPREFSERDGRIFTALIDQAGVAIDNRLLLEQTEEAKTRSENLYAASRIINTMSSYKDLVYAVVATSNDYRLDFRLTILEGELDATGWPTIGRIVAESKQGMAADADRTYRIYISADSPMRRREPGITRDDTPSLPDVTESVRLLRQDGYRFSATFPLFSANQPVALFSVLSTELRELTDEDYEVYRALTGQMSTQLENRRLLDRTEAALDETRRLYNASRAISSAQDSREVYFAAVEHLARPFMQENTALTIVLLLAKPVARWDAPYLECAYAWSSKGEVWISEGTTITSEQLPVGRLLLEANNAVYIRDTDEILGFMGEMETNDLLKQHGSKSAVIAPVQSRQKWYGVILCQNNQEANAFDEPYTRFMEAVADQVALAVENRVLFEDAQNEAQRAQSEAQRALALAQAAQLANQVGLDFEANLNEAFSSVAEAAGYDRWVLLLLNERTGLLEEVVFGLPGVEADREKQTYAFEDENPIVTSVRLNRTLVINNLRHYPAFQQFDRETQDYYAQVSGKFISTPVRLGGKAVGALMLGRSIESEDLDDGDEQLAETLAAQVAVAMENRRLFRQVENEQQRLRSVLSTLPAGVLVLEPETLRPILSNDKAEVYLGEALEKQQSFSAQTYNLLRTGSDEVYEDHELPIISAQQGSSGAFADDVAVIRDGHKIDLLVNALPITDTNGSITAIVATFSDISNLRSLENTLQENLRETVAVYEAQRQLSEATGLEEVLDSLLVQMGVMQPSEAYVLLLDEYDGTIWEARHLNQPLDDVSIFAGLIEEDRVVHAGYKELIRLPAHQSQALQATGVRSLLTVPLRARVRDVAIGWLVLILDNADEFTAEQERVLTQLGGVASTAIDNRYLIQGTRAALQETAALYSANTAISRSRDIEQLTEALRIAFAATRSDLFSASVARGLLEIEDLAVSDYADPSLLRTALLRYEIPEGGLFINDLTALTEPDDLERDLIAAANGQYHAVGAVSLRVKDGAQGILMVAYSQPHRFTEAETRYLSAISDSTSVVLDNVMLVEEIQSSLEETSVLYQAGRSLFNANTAPKILDVVVDYLIQPHIDQVFIALLNGRDWASPSAMVEIQANWSEMDAPDLIGVIISPDQFPAWNLLATPTVLTISDTEQETSLTDLERAGIASLDACSIAIIPLRVPNRAIGAIWISSRQPHTHTDREMRVYQSFGEQASLSMEAAYLLSQTERRARQLETSAEIASSAGKILDIETLLPQVVNLIQGAFGYDHVQVFLMDEEDEYAWVRASTGEAGKQLLSIGHKLRKGSSSVIGQVTATGKPSIALDTADANVVHLPNPYLPHTRSEMALPLFIKDQVIGALDVQSNLPNAFTQDDITALTTLAAQISISIDNARLYQSAQEQADRMSFLFESTLAAAAAEGLNETLQSVSDRLYESQEPLVVGVYLVKEYRDLKDNYFSKLEAVAVSGTNQPISEIEAPRLQDTQRFLSITARKMQPALIDDIRKESRYLPVMPNARSVIISPLVAGMELLGLVVMEDAQPNAYNHEDLQLLQALSGSISAIIQSAQLLERLQKANEELRELDRIKSDFLANMSHELRTPLNSIIGFSRVMLKGIDGPLTEMQEQDLTTIYNSGQHLLGLINDILDQAKIAAGKMDLKLSFFDVKPLVEGVKSIGLGLIKDKPIQLHVEVAQTLPKAYGDEFRTRQVLLNLVSNAGKFTSEGTVMIRVYPVQSERDGKQYVRIDVTDSGIGIAEKDIPLLFEAFRQVDSSLTRTAGGTGLGLPIARSLIEMQGGQMFVSSRVNVGSTFSITIPTQPTENEPKPDTQSTRPEDIKVVVKPALDTRSVPRMDAPPPARLMQQKRQILLIKDNPDMVDQFRRTLQREGFEVLVASIVLEAEAMASGLRPTLIVMDVNFQKGAGWDILKRLKDRDDTFDIPIIVVTLSDGGEKAYQMGAHTFIQRPFTPEDLAQAALSAEKESNTERILIIDDQPDAIRLLTQILGEHGNYRVFHANNGTDGIALVARRRPDLVILDLRMPDMDGFAVLNELRANPETAAIPVIVVTGDLDLKSDEHRQLENVRVLPKAGISEQAYEEFITRVQKHLSGEEGN
jgi:GAF domain-containing protein/DNA-binding response OmpR family regulator